MLVILTIPDTSGASVHREIARGVCHAASGSKAGANARADTSRNRQAARYLLSRVSCFVKVRGLACPRRVYPCRVIRRDGK